MTRDVTKSLCPECIHFADDEKFTCEAFPKGIPDVIVFGKFIHTKPFKGDNEIQFEQRKTIKLKATSKIEPVEPPDEAVVIERYTSETTSVSQKQAIKISQKLRVTYAKQLGTRAFGEMENAVLTYDAARHLAIVDKQIVGAISFHYDELVELMYIDHIGTVMAPKGTGAELVRAVVETACKFKVGMAFESTPESIGFWVRLGFNQNKKASYVFETDLKRVREIKEALGSTGRIKEKIGVA